jgi:hypothetical protein
MCVCVYMRVHEKESVVYMRRRVKTASRARARYVYVRWESVGGEYYMEVGRGR